MGVGTALDPYEIHVFLARPEAQERRDIDSAWCTLSPEERARAERFHFDRDKSIYVVAHSLLRRVLARYTRAAPEDHRFWQTRTGRPELVLPPGVAKLRFNLSHTRGLVGCAVMLDADLGFDVEAVRVPAPLEVADQYFSRPELDVLCSLPPAEQHDGFFRFWTLKEAYLKACGMGLSLPLDGFAVHVQAEGTAELDRLTADPTGTAPWSLRWWRLEGHYAAIAVQAPALVRVTLFEDQRLAALER
jgi:4'-phosphopantetheinyl transferase